MSLIDLVHQRGLLLPQVGRSVCLLCSPEELSAIYPLADAALRQKPGYRLIIASSLATIGETRRRYPHETVLPLPPLHRFERWHRSFALELMLLGRDYVAYGGPTAKSLQLDDKIALQTIIENLPSIKSTAEEARQVHPFIASLVRAAAGSPIESLHDLKRRLGLPEAILCLGNGPSSEDPRLGEIPHDSLFRVNWVWRTRGILTSPDLVITADPDRPAGKARPILGFPSQAAGLPLLARHCLLFHRPRRGYLFLDSFFAGLAAPTFTLRPSNGAVMIALAAKLKPRTIVIAGLDLYAHKTGRYPGDPAAVDGYARHHSRDTDVEFIRAALADYVGETIILSEGLSEALASSESIDP